ncbi:MAG: hypothetical protein FWG45_03920 [Oscillospiraceae bacterium]|nr:hypothetical protein [Oscillospiraceae bacterium]
MKKSKAMKAIERVALQEGISVKEARREMQKALDIAYTNKGTDVFWHKWGGRKPTLEEFVSAATDKVLTRLM